MTTTSEALIHPSHAINRLRVVTRLARTALAAGLRPIDLDSNSVRVDLTRLVFQGDHRRFDPETWTWVQIVMTELTA